MLYGRASPITTAIPTSGLPALIAASMFAGDMFLPAELMISSFLRSTIFTKPSSSISAMSPYQPPVRVDGLRGLLWEVPIAAHHDSAAHEQLAIVCELGLGPGSGLPTVPSRRVSSRFIVTTAEDSVIP